MGQARPRERQARGEACGELVCRVQHPGYGRGCPHLAGVGSATVHGRVRDELATLVDLSVQVSLYRIYTPENLSQRGPI